jgi:hypothetical protein
MPNGKNKNTSKIKNKNKNKNKNSQSEHASDDANRRDTVDELVSRDSAAASTLSPLPLPRPRSDKRCFANVTVLSMYANPKLRAALERLNLCDVTLPEVRAATEAMMKQSHAGFANCVRCNLSRRWLWRGGAAQRLPSLSRTVTARKRRPNGEWPREQY